MGISLASVRAAAKSLAQNTPVSGPLGVNLLLTDPTDFNVAITQALQQFDLDRQNLRVVDVTITTAGFRLVVKGNGAATELAGADAWSNRSLMVNVWHPFVATDQAVDPLSANDWRIVLDPGPKTVLELLVDTFVAAQVTRLAFTRPHGLTEAPNTVSDPATAPTASLVTALAGNVTNGLHNYVYTYLTAQGETAPSAAVALTVLNKAIEGQVNILVPASADPGITGVNVYRTITGGSGSKKLVGTLATNGGTVLDNVADADLGAVAPSANTAGGVNTVDDEDEAVLSILAASLILQLAANKAVQNTGNTNLPNDIVDRRSQSDTYRSRAKDLRDQYNILIGRGKTEDISAASGFADLDTEFSGGGSFLFHGRR